MNQPDWHGAASWPLNWPPVNWYEGGPKASSEQEPGLVLEVSLQLLNLHQHIQKQFERLLQPEFCLQTLTTLSVLICKYNLTNFDWTSLTGMVLLHGLYIDRLSIDMKESLKQAVQEPAWFWRSVCNCCTCTNIFQKQNRATKGKWPVTAAAASRSAGCPPRTSAMTYSRNEHTEQTLACRSAMPFCAWSSRFISQTCQYFLSSSVSCPGPRHWVFPRPFGCAECHSLWNHSGIWFSSTLLGCCGGRGGVTGATEPAGRLVILGQDCYTGRLRESPVPFSLELFTAFFGSYSLSNIARNHGLIWVPSGMVLLHGL